MPASIVEHTQFIHAQERRASVRAALSARATVSTAVSNRSASTCLEEQNGVRPVTVRLTTMDEKGDRRAYRAPVVSLMHARREFGRGPRHERRRFGRRFTPA